MNYKIEGAIKWISPIKEIGDAKVIDFVIEEVDEKYPQTGQFNIYSKDHATFGNKAEEFADKFDVGSLVEVEFKIKCREYTNKDMQKAYFTSLSVWNFKAIGNDGITAGQDEEVTTSCVPLPSTLEGEDDLPF